MNSGDKFLILWPPATTTFATDTLFKHWCERKHVFPFLATITSISRDGKFAIMRSEYGAIGVKLSEIKRDSAFDPITI